MMSTAQTTYSGPAMAPPPGLVADLENPPNVLYNFNVVAQTVCMTVAGLLFFTRSYVRLGFSRMPRQWILEDWMVCLSFIGLSIYSALMVVLMKNDGGVHQWNLTPVEVKQALYYFWIETLIYGPSIFVTKLSILLLYLRLLIPTRWSSLWTTVHAFIGISAAFYTAITIVKIWQCNPTARAWDKSIEGTCIDLPILLQVSGLFNTISDVLILVVPIKACWNLKLCLKKKLAVLAVFTIGAIAPIFAAIGFAVRVKAASSTDNTYNNPLLLLWATAEITTGVICACLPTLPSLFRNHRLRRSSAATTEPKKPHGNGSSGQPSTAGSYPHNQDFDYGNYIELGHASTRERGSSIETEIGKQEIVTTVKGGASPAESLKEIWDGDRRGSGHGGSVWRMGSSERVSSSGTGIEREKERDRRRGVVGLAGLGVGGIVRTVRIEQTDG